MILAASSLLGDAKHDDYLETAIAYVWKTPSAPGLRKRADQRGPGAAERERLRR